MIDIIGMLLNYEWYPPKIQVVVISINSFSENILKKKIFFRNDLNRGLTVDGRLSTVR